MRVAIIGGGLSGIVCAIQLQRAGITADLFERNSDLAEPYRHVGAALEIVLRPIKDPLRYLNYHYNINLKPSGMVKKVVHNSPSASTTITGNIGYFLHRGAGSDTIDNLLARDLQCKIFLNTEADYKDLKKDYDYVVVASGCPSEAKELGIWQDNIHMSVKGAVVSGTFDTDTFIVWINKDYCKSGYAYLAPFNDREASIALAVDGIGPEAVDVYWDTFTKTESINYKILETFKRVHYSGFVSPHRVDNLFFIGNAGGCLDPLLGFGVFPSIVTASEAAKSIAYGTDYEAAIKDVVDINRKLLEFRKVFNILDNKAYDLLIRSLGLPGVNSLVYQWNKLNVLKLGYSALKPLNALAGLRKK